LYGCEVLSLTLREENILRVFENRVQRGIFRPKMMKWWEAAETAYCGGT
jgi:hypothetical protein